MCLAKKDLKERMGLWQWLDTAARSNSSAM
jgi:hypothetical protein